MTYFSHNFSGFPSRFSSPLGAQVTSNKRSVTTKTGHYTSTMDSHGRSEADRPMFGTRSISTISAAGLFSALALSVWRQLAGVMLAFVAGAFIEHLMLRFTSAVIRIPPYAASGPVANVKRYLTMQIPSMASKLFTLYLFCKSNVHCRNS